MSQPLGLPAPISPLTNYTKSINGSSNNNNTNNNNKSSNRLYRTAANKSLSVAREIAALDFLVDIPLESEGKIVRDGFLQLSQMHKEGNKADEEDNESASEDEDSFGVTTSVQGKWWGKWIKSQDTSWSRSDPSTLMMTSKTLEDRDDAQLERPGANDRGTTDVTTSNTSAKTSVWQAYAPGRRLEGDDAIQVKIPVTTKTLTKQRSIARIAALREWETQMSHGFVNPKKGEKAAPTPLSDGRLFFSASLAYPVSVFSVIRYEPKREEQTLRRQKLEALGGGGSQFVFPTRDWRGVSYRSLLPRKKQDVSMFFDRFRSDLDVLTQSNREDLDQKDDDNASTDSSASDDSDEYQPTLLDDPEMKLGRHRQVMIGDKSSGPIVSSTIQFVNSDILKAELNKKFRERFDGWEPPRGARKFIGARVVDGEYKLMDPSMDDGPLRSSRKRQGSVTSVNSNSLASEKDTVTTTAKEMQIRMPPSLTLSKIRSLKMQALFAAVKAKLEIGTVALANVYFERLCLDCRVDKSNRRLTFAVCLLLATKLNEPNVGLVMHQENTKPAKESEGISAKLHSLVKPNDRSNNMFESLLGFFTQEWNLSLKRIFDAEWGVFAALGFSLHANPSHIAFHFKRMMKTLEWNIRDYLGQEMHDQWMRELDIEDERLRDREKRKDRRRLQRDERILNLRIEIENEVIRRKTEEREEAEKKTAAEFSDAQASPNHPTDERRKKGVGRVKGGGMRFLSRMRRVTSSGKMAEAVVPISQSEHQVQRRRRSAHAALHPSPSLPALASVSTETGTIPSTIEDSIAIDIPTTQSATQDDGSLSTIAVEDGALEV